MNTERTKRSLQLRMAKHTQNRMEHHFLKIISRICFFAYTFLVLGLTIFFRSVKMEPLSIVWEGWTFHRADSSFDLNPLLNIVMLIPFTFFLYAGFDRLSSGKRWWQVLIQAAVISFCMSLFIETMQIVTRLGTFQISDLTYNTISGVIGMLIWRRCRCHKPSLSAERTS